MTDVTMTPPAKPSSQVAAVGVDGDSLLVEFHGRGKPNTRYRYWREGETGDHPTVHHDGIVGADSAGQHFGQHVRGKYPFEKLGG